MEVAGLSEGMRALLDAHQKVHESVLRLQAQIVEEEAAYLEETPHGNIVRGWDGFIDAKPPRKDAAPKKPKPYSDAEHLFSGCCAYAELATEPSIDLVYPAAADGAATIGKRKLSTSAIGGGPATTSGASPATSKLHRAPSLSERKAPGAAAGKGASGVAAAASAAGKASKLKKRRREQQVESQESVELEAASPAQEASSGGADKDFLDVF